MDYKDRLKYPRLARFNRWASKIRQRLIQGLKDHLGVVWLAVRWFFWELCGLHAMWLRLSPPKGGPSLDRKPVTFGILLLTFYTAVFTLASGMYQSKLASLNSRVDAIVSQVGNRDLRTTALSQISSIQRMKCPREPVWHNPKSVIVSVFFPSEPYNPEVLDRTNAIVQSNRAFLSRVILSRINLHGVDLTGGILRNAILKMADLRRAVLEGAVLDDAFMFKADLEGANLNLAEMREAKLGGANLRLTKLRQVGLQGADLTRADLQGSDLNGADLKGADLKGANLSESDLRWAKNLTTEQLSKCKTLFKTKLPPALKKEIQAKWPHLLDRPK